MSSSGLAIAWSGLLLFDSVVVTITVYRGVKMARLNDQHLVKLLLRDGEFFFRPSAQYFHEFRD